MGKRFKKEQKPLEIDFGEATAELGQFRTICDLFHPGVPDLAIQCIGQRAFDFGLNRYILHTKNPERAANFYVDFPINTTLCATVESKRHYPEISGAPSPNKRITGLRKWRGSRMITIEPVLDFDVEEFIEMIKYCGDVGQVNVGADSGNSHLPEPPKEKTGELIAELKRFTTVAQKKNLGRLLK
jgi:hypothetical protein